MLYKSHELYTVLTRCWSWTNAVNAPGSLSFPWLFLESSHRPKTSWLSH